MPTDGWVTAALADDDLVVELLYRIKQSSQQKKNPPVKKQFLSPPLGWGQRQRRSKLVGKMNKNKKKKNQDLMIRCSPTTPLSYSGGASTSDGCDESSRPSDPSSSGRSKGSFAYDTAAANKRSKRKRTIDELKEEESLQLKEQVHLHKEVEKMRVTLKEQQVRGDNLKRFKLNLRMPSASDNVKVVDSHAPPHPVGATAKHGHAELLPTISMQSNQQPAVPCYFKAQEEGKNPAYFAPPAMTMQNYHQQEEGKNAAFFVPPAMMTMQNIQQPAAPCLFKAQEEEKNPACFVLPDLNMVPDLNMMPAEDDSS